MKIEVTMKTVYGKDLIYPVNDTAKKLSALLNKKTFTQEHIKAFRELGFEIELVNGYSLTLREE